MELTLKRGSGRHFPGQNWKTAAEKHWVRQHSHIVPSGRETHVGLRELDGVPHAVFQCLNDEFFAQPVDVCEKPIPEDPMEVVFEYEKTEEAEEEAEKPKKKTEGLKTSKVMTFSGKNWKLAAEKKWKSSTGFIGSGEELGTKVGEKTFGATVYDIHKSSSGFVAVKQGE